IKPSIILIDEIENNLRYLIEEQNEKDLTLRVHPYVHAYLTKGILSRKVKWILRFKTRISVYPSFSYHFLEYRFFNKIDDEIKL
ncbi:MAG: ribonuclease E/G, partial [Bacteroidota bacterium]